MFPGGEAFIGLYQDVNDSNYSEPSGGWKWVNGNSGTAASGVDFTLSSSTITIPAGQTTGMATVTAVQDVLVEGNETVVLDITDVVNGTENGTQQQTITIIDDDSQIVNVTLSVSPSSIAEAGGVSTVSAILSAVSDQAVTVVLAASGTATGGGTDYTLSSSTITIPAGQTTGTTTVTAVQDVLDEVNETVVLDITDVVNGTENGTQQQTITIIDDDEPPLPSVSLSVSPAEISENGGISTIMATLSTNHDEMVTVNLSVTGTATGGSDYVLGSQSIIIPAGDTTGSTVVYAINDDIDESKVFQESFSWSNWRSGEPNNFGTGEDYAMMIDREWNDICLLYTSDAADE